MRKKELKLVVTFHTMQMAMEKACKKRIHRARIIPVPNYLSRMWTFLVRSTDRRKIVAMMEKVGIEPEDLHGVPCIKMQ